MYIFWQNINLLYILYSNLYSKEVKIVIFLNFNPYSDFLNNDLSFQSDTHVREPTPVPDAKVLPGTSSSTSQHKDTCKS